MKSFLGIVMFLASLTAVDSEVLAAEQATSNQKQEKKEIDRFLELRDRRATLLEEIPRLREELQSIRFRQRDIKDVEFDLERSKRSLESAKQEKPIDKRNVAFFEERVKRDEEELKRFKADYPQGIEQEIKKKNEELRAKERERAIVESELNDLLNVELARQKFKELMSKVFAALVAAVIIGFFFIAWWDDKVRQTIFSGQAGIQFVTLFSLVIAIILFGITGILEGKELSALLGGLSGYILGRATS